MNSNKLLLNPSKTEFLLIGTKQQRLKFSQLTTLSLGNAGASFQLFLGRGEIFFYFSVLPDYWKIWKKQHFICSNLTLFIAPFFLFSLFFSFFLFFFFLFFFFLFPWGGGRRPPQPPSNDAPAAMISSQSALLLVILASSLILTCHSQIKLTPCLSLVIFISETFVVFVISFLFLQLQRLPIHSSPANLIIVIHSTMAFRKLTWTKYSAYKILWLVSLQIHQNLNTLHQYSKNYIGFQSNNASITNCVFLHIKRFKFSNLPIFTIVFLFLLTLCLQDHLIHRFCPSHMSEHLWVKGPFLSLLQDSGTPSRLTPVTRYLFLHSAQNSKPIFSS